MRGDCCVALSALLAPCLLALQIRRHARRQDVLLLSALVSVGLTDFLFLALPNLAGVHVAAFGIDARMLVQGMVPARVSGSRGRRRTPDHPVDHPA